MEKHRQQRTPKWLSSSNELHLGYTQFLYRVIDPKQHLKFTIAGRAHPSPTPIDEYHRCVLRRLFGHSIQRRSQLSTLSRRQSFHKRNDLGARGVFPSHSYSPRSLSSLSTRSKSARENFLPASI